MPKQRPRRTPVRAISAPELCDRYAHLYTAVITDVLDKRGCYEQTLPRDITGLTPETRVAGLAFPASGKVTRNSDTARALRAFLAMLSAVPRDAVLVASRTTPAPPRTSASCRQQPCTRAAHAAR